MVEWKSFEGSKVEFDTHVLQLGGGIYQSYAWGEYKRRVGQEIYRVVGYRDQEIIAIASILIRRLFGVAICWIPGGVAGELSLYDKNFRKSVRIMSGCKIDYFRMSIETPYVENKINTLKNAGWIKSKYRLGSGLTLHYTCVDDAEVRLAKTSTNWRHNLRRSHRNNLTVGYWKQPDVTEMENIYRDMEALKNLPVQYNRKSLQNMIDAMGEQLIIHSCHDQQGRLLSFRAAAIFGDRAWDLLAAANKDGRKVYASHATIWSLMNHCKDIGIKIYDLSGVDPIKNKGVYDFKHGIGSELIQCLGEWESTNFPSLNIVVNFFMKFHDYLNNFKSIKIFSRI